MDRGGLCTNRVLVLDISDVRYPDFITGVSVG